MELIEAESIIETANNETWLQFQHMLQLQTAPNVFCFQYDTDLVRLYYQSQLENIDANKNVLTFNCENIRKPSIYLTILELQNKKKYNIIQLYNIQYAVEKFPEILSNLNVERDELFKNIQAHIIFWFDNTTYRNWKLKAYDFSTWVQYNFEFTSPAEALTKRQQLFTHNIQLENELISLPDKEPTARIQELETKWNELYTELNKGKIHRSNDLVTITKLLSKELRENANYEKAKTVLENTLQLNSINEDTVSYFKNEIALVYQNLGEYEKAKKLLELALNSDIKNFGNEHPTVAILQSNLALVYQDLGEYEKAKKLLELALDSVIKNFGNEHPTVAVSQSNLALVYKDIGEYEKAKNLLELALKSDFKNFGNEHPKFAILQSNLALVYEDLGEYEKAKKLLELALEISKIKMGENHPNTITIKNNLASVITQIAKK